MRLARPAIAHGRQQRFERRGLWFGQALNDLSSLFSPPSECAARGRDRPLSLGHRARFPR
jgi:hypothetical protein